MYAVLMETNGEEFESWYYFIKYEGNEEALQHLADQLKKVEDMYIYENLSTFDLDIDNLVSETTAKEMIKLDLNSITRHRKFDGEMKKIDLKLEEVTKNKKKLIKLFKKLGYGRIERYVDGEDIEVSSCDEGSDNIENEREVSSESDNSDLESSEELIDSSSEESKKVKPVKNKGKKTNNTKKYK